MNLGKNTPKLPPPQSDFKGVNETISSGETAKSALYEINNIQSSKHIHFPSNKVKGYFLKNDLVHFCLSKWVHFPCQVVKPR